MNLAPAQKSTINQVINVFETGKPEGDYARVVRRPDGPKGRVQISYGRCQATESNSLKDLIKHYISLDGWYVREFKTYIDRIGNLHNDNEFFHLLIKAADDVKMCHAQDVFFDKRYFKPAEKWADKNRLRLPLSMLVIFDSFIHSGGILKAISVESPMSDEKQWITQYVQARKQWLATHKKTILHKTIYRMETFEAAINDDNWDILKPINANGVIINAEATA